MSNWKDQLKLGLTNHPEPHFTGSRIMRDIVIGMSDGLTVPFALAAGLSGAVVATGIIVTAGFAEIAAGSIAMGLGGYLAAKSDAEHYHAERIREETEVVEKTDAEIQEIIDIFDKYVLYHSFRRGDVQFALFMRLPPNAPSHIFRNIVTINK